MGRIMTLRGSWTSTFGPATAYGATSGRLIFEYESPDRTRAWKVRYASAWVQECMVGATGNDQRALWQVSLLTDQLDSLQAKIVDAGSANTYQKAIGPADNRSIAWIQEDMLIRDNVTADWIGPDNGSSRSQMEFVCDANRIITNELYIVSYGLTEGTALTDIECSYYIELEEIKLTPQESLFAQLKGTGQEVGPQFRGFPTS